MRWLVPSALEAALLQVMHEVHGNAGFPRPQDVQVVQRENTGAGRYVDLVTSNAVGPRGRYYDMGGRYIAMPSVPHGLMAVCKVVNERAMQLEIVVYGVAEWDGDESVWAIVQ